MDNEVVIDDTLDENSKKKKVNSIGKVLFRSFICLAVFFLVVYGGILYYLQNNHKMQFDISSVTVETYKNSFNGFKVDNTKGNYMLVHIKGTVKSWFYMPYTYNIKNIYAATSGSYFWDYCTGIEKPLVVKKFQSTAFELSCVLNITDKNNFREPLTKEGFIDFITGMPFVASDVTTVGLFKEKSELYDGYVKFWIQDSPSAAENIKFIDGVFSKAN